jgi:predicted AlkP superfamily pyrophosphatase or phosphodiesterase
MLLWCGACGHPDADDGQRKVLLIGLDGVRVDVLVDARTPNLDALAAAGFFADSVRTADPTVSGPCWSIMLTGVWPAKHGVLGNEFSDNRYAIYPDFLSRLETTDSTFSTYAVVDWPPFGSPASGGPLLSSRIDRIELFDGDSLGYHAADSMSVDAAVRALAEADLDAAFVYLGDIDVVGHEHGTLGPEYRAAIEWADTRVGMLVDAVRRRETFEGEDWLVIVSADHGQTDAGTHGGESAIERTVFLIVSGSSAAVGTTTREGNVVDVAATALAHLGVVIDPEWGLDGWPVGLTDTR